MGGWAVPSWESRKNAEWLSSGASLPGLSWERAVKRVYCYIVCFAAKTSCCSHCSSTCRRWKGLQLRYSGMYSYFYHMMLSSEVLCPFCSYACMTICPSCACEIIWIWHWFYIVSQKNMQLQLSQWMTVFVTRWLRDCRLGTTSDLMIVRVTAQS